MRAQNRLGPNIGNELLQQIQDMLEQYGFGNGKDRSKAGNFSGQILKYTSGVPTEDDVLTHDLGRVPVYIFPLCPGNKPGAVLQFISFTNKEVRLRCNVAGTSFTLYVE